MSELSAYEKQRLANMAENAKVLAALGIESLAPQRQVAASKHLCSVTAKKIKRPRPTEVEALLMISSSRRSPRFANEVTADAQHPSLQTRPPTRSSVLSSAPRLPPQEKPPDKFGEIDGFPCGSGWEMRADCCADLVHRATVAGIVGTPEAGCFSIVLNGGYPDDVDLGEALTYTGSGGRSLKGTSANPKNLRVGPATHNQTLEGKEGRYNASLYKSFESGEPVRVVRGYKLDSRWAPLGLDYGGSMNYRYDGLYKVEEAWLGTGLEGYKVWKFALKRLAGQPELVAQAEEAGGEEQA